MSSANNSTKSGKPCGSPDDYYENELVDWLQYPLGDSLEKGYCSDIFGQWPSSSTVVTKIPAAFGVSKPSSATSIGIDPCAYSDTGPPSKPDCAVLTVDSGLCDGKERVGNSSFGARVACADGALALGAERAAGLVSQSGRDEFSKVRTSMQPLTGSQLTPLAGSQLDGKGAQPFQVRNVTEVEPVVGNMVGNMSQNPVSGPKCPSEPLNVVNSYGASLSSSLASTGPSSLSKSISFSCYRPRNSVEAPLQVLHAQESGCSRVTDEAAVRRVLDKSSSASSRGQPGVGQVSGVMSTRFNSPALEAPSERPGVFGMTEMTVAAPSSRSLSGTTLSTKETSSNSGKRKVDDSESQSEDVEGESSVDVKQPRKPSSSKRNRAAEVHNLSERNRRNRINEKLRALQDLIPNSSKTDKASVLDEAIEYMKTLQMQLQMVSMRSGLNVSPMMIPLGMPHLQMAPLHPVGLGVPVGHAGLGMGVGLPTSMGMGMLDLSQGLPGRPLQQAHASLNRFSVPCQVNSAAGSQDCPLDSANTGSLPSQFMSMPHNFSQIHPGLNNLSSAYCQQQQDHRQHDVHHLEAREHIPHEQTGKG